MLTPRHRLTEAALLLLHAVRPHVVGPPNAARSGRIRLLRSSLGPVDPEVMRREAAFLRMVSVTEAYLDALQVDLLTGKLSPNTETLLRVIEELEVVATSNWANRKRAFNRIHKVRLGELAGWPEIDAAIQVRNTIAHGLGSLTARQRSNAGLPAQISKVKVLLSGGRMHISVLSLRVLEESCRKFILAVDQAH